MMRKLCKSFLIFIVLILAVTPKQSYAGDDSGIGRTRSCDSSDGSVEGLEFDPADGGDDVEFVMTNEVCLAVIATSYASVKAAVAAMNSACGNGSSVRITPSLLLDGIDAVKGGVKCSQEKQVSCCIATAAAFASLTAAVAALGTIYEVAKDVYDNTEVCGADWMKANPSKYDFSAANYKQTVQSKIEGYIRDKNYTSTGLDQANKYYREWFYDGKEYEDNPYQGSACYDPTRDKDQYGNYKKQRYYLKGTNVGNYNCKKYLVPQGQTTKYDAGDMRDAYECCIDRSQNFMCLDYKNTNVVDNPPSQIQRTPTFCKKGENCTMMRPDYYKGLTSSGVSVNTSYGDYDSGTISASVLVPQVQNGSIWFKIQQSEDSLLCAETYSLCPYNFYVGGGSDTCSYYKDGTYDDDKGVWTIITQEQIDDGDCADNSIIRNADCTYNEKAGKCKNYCQYLVHCAKTSTEGFVYESSLGSPYFSQACIDFVGDSKNNTDFNAGILGKQVHFTAPIAQCMKETLENLFYNRSGHSKCLSYGEYPNADGICASGLYVTDGNFTYKKGNKVKDNSFFQTIQNVMSLVIKLAITFALVFYGANLLLWKTSLGDKKSILVFVFKIALVMYFCVGTAWQDIFFRGFYDSSMVLANMLFKVETMQDSKQQDGCQFGTVSLPDGTQKTFSTSYPEGKEYLAIWDTIDCKMMRYLGFGPQMTSANIASMVISSYFFGPIGIYFAMSVMIFGFFLVSLGIRALHVFISSAAAIILLIFVSPLIIPCGMFERTKGIFDGWLGKLISYCLQPMILFAYVAIFITVMDQTLIGSATFHGNPPVKTMSCEKTCVDADGALVSYDGDQAPACDEDGQKMINPLDDSVACLLNFQDFGTWKAFTIIGVALPVLQNLFEENVKTRILTMLKGALVMFLLYKFMDEIPGIIEALVGGGLAKKGQADPIKMLTGAMSMVKGASQRLARVGRKAAGGAFDIASRNANYGGNKGKKTAEAKGGKGDEHSTAEGGSGGGSDGSEQIKEGAKNDSPDDKEAGNDKPSSS